MRVRNTLSSVIQRFALDSPSFEKHKNTECPRIGTGNGPLRRIAWLKGACRNASGNRPWESVFPTNTQPSFFGCKGERTTNSVPYLQPPRGFTASRSHVHEKKRRRKKTRTRPPALSPSLPHPPPYLCKLRHHGGLDSGILEEAPTRSGGIILLSFFVTKEW